MKKVLQLLTLTTLLTTPLFAAPIHDAARAGNLAEAERLINEDPTRVHDRYFGRTPLHSAARNGRMRIVQLLLAHGAAINVQCHHNGDTPLHRAAEEDRTEIVELLLEKGADVNAQNNDGQTPLDIARQLNYPEVIELLAVVPLLQSLRDLSAPELVTVR